MDITGIKIKEFVYGHDIIDLQNGTYVSFGGIIMLMLCN